LLRQQKGLTQKQAAQRMGISQQAFSRLEHSAWLQGEKLQALLTALQCTTADVEKAMSLLTDGLAVRRGSKTETTGVH
jgi:transcriptional regulator with XRE-family HTH domain